MSSDGASQQKKRKKIDIDYVRERLTAVLTEKAPAKLPTMKKILIKVAKGSVPFKTLQLEVYKKYKTAIYRTAEEAEQAARKAAKKGGSTPKAATPKAATPKASKPQAKGPKTKGPSAAASSSSSTASPKKAASKASRPRKASAKEVPKQASSDKAAAKKAASPRKAKAEKTSSKKPQKLDFGDDGSDDDQGDDEQEQVEDEVQNMPIRPANKKDDGDLLSETEEEEDFTESEDTHSVSSAEVEERWTVLKPTLGEGAEPDKLIEIIVRTKTDPKLEVGVKAVAPTEAPAAAAAAAAADAAKTAETEDQSGSQFDTYRMECRIKVCMHTLVNNDYFRARLQGSDKGKTTIILPANSADLYRAYVIALQYLAIGNRETFRITLQNQFDIYAAACKLRVRCLLEECKSFVEKHLNSDTFIDAVKRALSVKDINMLQSCYQWLKRNGFKKQGFGASTPRGGGSTPKPRGLASIFRKKTSEDVTTPKEEGAAASVGRLSYDPLERMLVAPNGKTVSVDVFKVLRKHEIKIKKKFYKIGAISGKYEKIKIKDDEDGFDGMIQCTLYRRKKVNTKDGLATIYQIYAGQDKKEFLIAARILEGGRRFVISSSPTNFDIYGQHYLGECFCNFLGTNFSLFDHGMDLSLAQHNPLQLTRIEHSLVVYKTNVLGRVPNSLQLILPRNPDTEQLDADFEGSHTIKRDVVTKAFKGKQLKKVYICNTRAPQWNEELEAWTMDFQGRVILASKKNFQIVCDDFGDDVLMLFGKNTKNQFAFDFKSPLTIIQAFGLALSAFADKLAVT